MDGSSVRRRRCAGGARILVLALVLSAAQARAVFVVTEPWVRPAGRSQTTEVFVNLTSTEGATLVALRSDAAATAAVHAAGQGKAELTRLPLPAGITVALAPGRTRIVLEELARTLRLGDRVVFTLTVEAADGTRREIPMDAEVRLRSPTDDHRRAHAH
jgi:copper(I)-binding protein